MTPQKDHAPTTADEKQGSTKRVLKRLLLASAKALILALVCIWLFKNLYSSWDDISQYEWSPHWGWLVASGLFYLVGFFFAALFWHIILHRLSQRSSLFESLEAYYYSQLGKYVPGKALVVVIRTSMLSRRSENRASVIATSVFYETLTMMGTGAFIGAFIVLLTLHDNRYFSILAFGVALGSLVPLLPPIFTRIVRLLRIGKNDPETQSAFSSFNYQNLFLGIVLMTILWSFFGLSLWAALRGLGLETEPLMTTLPRYISVVSLAMSLGFVMLISPGGLGIRELILSTLLIPYLSVLLAMPSNASFTIDATALATIVSLLQRIISILAELSASLALFVVKVVRPSKTESMTEY